jgi:hypothetical protein
MTQEELLARFIENLKPSQILTWANLISAMGSMPQADRDKILSMANSNVSHVAEALGKLVIMAAQAKKAELAYTKLQGMIASGKITLEDLVTLL